MDALQFAGTVLMAAIGLRIVFLFPFSMMDMKYQRVHFTPKSILIFLEFFVFIAIHN